MAGLGNAVFAQTDKLIKAQECYQTKDFKCAKSAIDSVIIHTDTKNDPFAWSLRGYIYFELYKKSERNLLNSSLRDSSINSILKSNALNPEAAIAGSNKKLLENYAAGYHSICKSLLSDSLNFTRSLMAYEKFKFVQSKANPDYNFKEKDIEYYLAAGSVFQDRYFSIDTTNKQLLDISKTCYLKVLDIEPDNTNANFSMGIIYYNQGAKIMRDMEYDVTLAEYYVYEENAVKLFKQSLPFMLKVYEKEPQKKTVIEGLAGIYDGLKDKAKSKEFIKKLEELNKK